MSAVIETRGLTRRYGSRVGAEGVSLAVAGGDIFGFLGPNGAGKTTTIRVLLGFLRPDGGSASILGLDCWRASPRLKRRVGYVPGDLRLYPWMTGRNALRLVGRIRGQDLSGEGRRLAERFNLEMTVPVRKMSRGMRQKLGLILALAPRPEVLVLDEPTSGLDPLMQDSLSEVLRELADAGHTVFFSSHRLSEVEKLCDRVAIVRRGRIVADETLASLRRRAPREVVLVFDDDQTAAAEPPPFLRVAQRRGGTWRCRLDGEPAELVRWAANRPLRDLTISPPDLETLFRDFYRDEEGTAP